MVNGKAPITKCENVAKFQTVADIDKPNVTVIENPGGSNERFARANFKQAKIVIFPDNVTIFDEILKGNADVMISESVETIVQQKLRPGLCAVNPDKPLQYGEMAWLLPARRCRDEGLDGYVVPPRQAIRRVRADDGTLAALTFAGGLRALRLPSFLGFRAFSRRRFAEDGAAAYDAALGRRIVRCSAMQEAAVVPDDELVRPPAMLVGEVGVHRQRVQFLDERAPFGVRHADDVFRVVSEIETFASGLRMHANDRLIHGRRFASLGLGQQIPAVSPGSGEVEVVYRSQVGDALFPFDAQPLVRAVHVTEVRLAASSRGRLHRR
jgi:hypothetical protein